MECNKDEAIRARSLAEMKMQNNDFEGARKIVLKAQSLYPDLDNIGQLRSICDVHCSAQNRLGSEKDWYGILQVEKLADVFKVKKQYRRLALSLHPDKNRFPGAEGAFKLICEANTVLSDPAKKSLYDNKINFIVTSGSVNSPSLHTNSSQFNNPNSAQSNVSNGFSRQNLHQATQSTSTLKQEIFWTVCPYCGVRYQYLRQYVMRSLRCQQCSKVFVAYDIGTQGASMNSKLSQSSASREKVAPNRANSKPGIQKDKGPSASHVGSSHSEKKVKPKPDIPTGGGSEGIHVASPPHINVDLKTKEAEDAKSRGAKQGGTSNGNSRKRQTSDVRNRRKRGRQGAEESSEGLDSSSASGEDVIARKFSDGATNMKSEYCHVQSPRRSSRKKQHVFYDETGEDCFSGLKSAQATKKSEEKAQKDALDIEDTKPEIQESVSNGDDLPNSKRKRNIRSKESFQKQDTGCDEEVKASGATDVKSDTAADAHEMETGADKGSSHPDDVGTVSYCADPEFSDFDREREETRFAANQFWACYDTLDGMPRFYAKVKKVCYNPFNLIITWLEAVPINNTFVEWVAEEWPVGCGTFKFGQTEETSIRISFSHQVQCERGKKKGSYLVYPREGEVWAVFKDWNINWTSNPENKEFKYELVEVLSSFVPGTGIKVCYLDKVGGFVCLFQRVGQGEDDSFLIGPDELYRFSHLVPCFKMTGTEREGVPVGSFELDPAALPVEPEDMFYPCKVKMERMNTASGSNLPMKNGKPTESKGKSKMNTPKKSGCHRGGC